MTLDALIAAWEAEALRTLPLSPTALAEGLEGIATLLRVVGQEFAAIDHTSVVASPSQRDRIFAVLSGVSNSQTDSPVAVAYKAAYVLSSVAMLRLLQSAGLFEGL